MEPVVIVLVPGVIGGVILAALLASKRIAFRTDGPDRRLAPPSPSLINMAHIPVEGGGGLGIVAAVIVVALADSRIRVAIGIAALLGVAFAWVLIALRRERGPLTSGGDDSGAHSMLGLGREEQPGQAPAPSGDRQTQLPASRADAAGFRLAVGH